MTRPQRYLLRMIAFLMVVGGLLVLLLPPRLGAFAASPTLRGPHPRAGRDRIRAKFARQHSSARYRLRPILQTDRRSAWAIEAMDEKPRG